MVLKKQWKRGRGAPNLPKGFLDLHLKERRGKHFLTKKKTAKEGLLKKETKKENSAPEKKVAMVNEKKGHTCAKWLNA